MPTTAGTAARQECLAFPSVRREKVGRVSVMVSMAEEFSLLNRRATLRLPGQFYVSVRLRSAGASARQSPKSESTDSAGSLRAGFRWGSAGTSASVRRRGERRLLGSAFLDM